MKKILLLAIVGIVLTGSAFASLTTCPTATFDVYSAPGFSCMSGALLFSNFSYSPSAAPPGMLLPSSSVTVTPQTVTGNEGFQFVAGWNVATQPSGANEFEDSLISFEIQGPLTDLHLSYNGSFLGTGITGVTEQYCVNHVLAGCPSAQAGQLSVSNPTGTVPSAKFDDNATFAPGTVQSLWVSKDINVASGIAGSAHISQVTNTYSNAPEPMTLMLVGSGLLSLGLFRKRFRS